MKLGIVGLPNVGKSTLFNAITNAGVAADNYAFCTQKLDKLIAAAPNIGFSVSPSGINTPAASGMPMVL